MKIVLAPDSFKESMTATEAVAAMRAGVHAVIPDAECVGVPMADGGEGTVDAVVDALHGRHVEVEVSDALGRTVTARYGHIPLRQLAVIEMAAAAGLELIPPQQRDILRASTFGVGQLIRSALERGAEELLIGLGGSATNDGGTGMLTALGASFVDSDGNPLEPGGAALSRLDRIDVSGLDPRLRDTRIHVASDVTAPLLGPAGATAVFGPQKGATTADVELLETALTRLATVTSATFSNVDPKRPGAGAAGGVGFALVEFLGAESKPGVDEVAETVGLEQALRRRRLGVHRRRQCGRPNRHGQNTFRRRSGGAADRYAGDHLRRPGGPRRVRAVGARGGPPCRDHRGGDADRTGVARRRRIADPRDGRGLPGDPRLI